KITFSRWEGDFLVLKGFISAGKSLRNWKIHSITDEIHSKTRKFALYCWEVAPSHKNSPHLSSNSLDSKKVRSTTQKFTPHSPQFAPPQVESTVCCSQLQCNTR